MSTTNTLTLKELEEKLSKLSHNEDAIAQIQEFSEALKDTRTRLGVFNADQAIVRAPILPQQTKELGFNEPDDDFSLLQGDIVITEAAYFLGERIGSAPKYVVLNSSCDLIPERRNYAALLRIKQVRESEPGAKEKLNLLLRFRRRESMYLPVLPQDDNDILCNVIDFDGICQIRSADLLLANRRASLSVAGWRIFASFSRVALARANPREREMRVAIERGPVGEVAHAGPAEVVPPVESGTQEQ